MRMSGNDWRSTVRTNFSLLLVNAFLYAFLMLYLQGMFGQFSALHFKGLKYDLYFFNNSVFLCGKIWTNDLNSLSANPAKWSNTQLVGCCRRIA